MSTNIPSEIWRYYMLCIRPEKSDSIFTWSDFASKNNNELLTNVGNLCNRTLKFLESKYGKVNLIKRKSRLLIKKI